MTMQFKGIKKAAGDTKRLDGWNGHVQVNYDPNDDTVWTQYESDDSWTTRYHDEDIVSIFFRKPATMEEIKKKIINEMNRKPEEECW